MDAGAPILKSPADGVLRILFVGDLDEPRKGARLLAAAFARVKQALPAARLEYSGSASDAIRNAILAEVPEATRPDVIFHGVGFVEELPFVCACNCGFESGGVGSDRDGAHGGVGHRHAGRWLRPCRNAGYRRSPWHRLLVPPRTNSPGGRDQRRGTECGDLARGRLGAPPGNRGGLPRAG